MKQSFMPSGLFNSWPLQFLRTGLYYRSYGYLGARTADGYWWSATAGSATYGRNLGTHTGGVHAQDNYFRGHGFALREVAVPQSRFRDCRCPAGGQPWYAWSDS